MKTAVISCHVTFLFIMQISKVLGEKIGQLREVRLIRDRGGTSKGFAFLEFYRLEDARMWLEENRVGCVNGCSTVMNRMECLIYVV